MGVVQAGSVVCFAVLVGIFGYKFGLLFGILIALVSVFVYCYSGIGVIRQVGNQKSKNLNHSH